MKPTYEYYTKFNWFSNPFTLRIFPDLMVGYSTQTEALLSHVFNHHKFAMVIGPTGSGKTTLLTWLNTHLNNNKFNSFYIPKPPVNEEDLILLFKAHLRYNLLDRIRFGALDMNNITKFLVKKTWKRYTVFLIDEIHESSLEVLEWLRTINDIVPNLLLIFAGLPTFEKKIETELPTLFMRVNTRVYLEFLNDIETESLIQRRIEKAGGEGIKPFTRDAVEKIYEITGGFPREVIKICDELVREAAKNNISTINASFVDQAFAGLKISEIEEIKISLTSKQTEILEILNKQPNLSPTEIIELFDIKSYKSKSHAIRSINNILRRLMKEDLLKRKKVGNKYVYSLSGKSKTLFTEA